MPILITFKNIHSTKLERLRLLEKRQLCVDVWQSWGRGAGMRVPEEPERHLPHPMKQIQIKHGTKSLQALLLLEYL